MQKKPVKSQEEALEPYAPHDYEFCVKCAPWTFEQAAILAVGLFPASWEQEALAPAFETPKQKDRYQKAITLLNIALRNKAITDRLSISDFLLWSQFNDFDLPKGLKKAIEHMLKLRGDKNAPLQAKERYSLLLILRALISGSDNDVIKSPVANIEKKLQTLCGNKKGDFVLDEDTVRGFVEGSKVVLANYLKLNPRG